jgi:hypothetical protein
LSGTGAFRDMSSGLVACHPSDTLSQVGPDKYRGRIDAVVATRDTPDVSAALLKGGFARSYDGGRRDLWC